MILCGSFSSIMTNVRTAGRRWRSSIWSAGLLITGRKKDALDALAEDLLAAGAKVLALDGDITDSAFVRSLPKAAEDHFNGLDVLINCAGIAQNQHFEEVTEEDYDRIMNLNARAPFFLC